MSFVYDFEALRESVLWTHEQTRTSHPGLALPAAVAHGHGGGLDHRALERGSVLAFSVPA